MGEPHRIAPRVAAIVVHYGDPAPTLRCLNSLDGIDEVILVDQPPVLFGEHPRVTARLEPGANLGFAAACNRGVEAATSPFVLLINNDALLTPGSTAALHEALPTLAADVAGACLKLLCLDGVTIQSVGGLWFTRDGIGFPHGFGETDRGQYDALPTNRIGVPSGAAAVYRTSTWRECGGMSEEFFCYCEDGDLGLRMVAAGARFAWLSQVVIHHELSSSSGPHSLFKALHVERNHFATMVHSAPLAVLMALPVLTLWRIGRTAIDALLGRGAGAGLGSEATVTALAGTLAKAWLQALRMLPAAFTQRALLLQRHPSAAQRVGNFLKQRCIPLSSFARSRNVGETFDE